MWLMKDATIAGWDADNVDWDLKSEYIMDTESDSVVLHGGIDVMDCTLFTIIIYADMVVTPTL